MHFHSKIILFLSIIMKCSAFYENAFNLNNMPVVKPKTNDELTTALCSTMSGNVCPVCADDDLKLIIIDRMFDFIGTEGTTTEQGCWHESSAECYLKGQQKLNVNNQCIGLEAVNVTYDNAGLHPLYVGSNKYITGVGKQVGIKGKGLYLRSVFNVVIQNISIIDINPRVIWGGDALLMEDVRNVLIDGNTIQRIGRQMIVTGFGSCQKITISNNVLDGSTPYSARCNGRHYWTLLFLGKDDRITIYKNKIFEISGRFPHMTGLRNSSVLVHMIENTFHDIDTKGGMELEETTARLLAEGNNFTNVPVIFLKNQGSVYFPLTKDQSNACISFIGRPCEVNTLVNSTLNNDDTSDLRVLNDLQLLSFVLTAPGNDLQPFSSALTAPGNGVKTLLTDRIYQHID